MQNITDFLEPQLRKVYRFEAQPRSSRDLAEPSHKIWSVTPGSQAKPGNKIWSVLFIAFYLLGIPSRATAQIVPDATLPNNSVVTPNGDSIEITGGTEAGGNLFHSFEEFSVPTGGTAFFNNALNIENIISRVTGGSISNIDGLIRANGTANLFLLNPNGIIFGSNASLNIGGSFIGSTANNIKFGDGTQFSALDTRTSLLTVSVPLGLQYGSNSGAILVQGSGNNLSLNPANYEFIRNDRPVGLQVQPGQTLALVGGNVTLAGGNLTAQQGRIELGSVDVGDVKLTPTYPGWRLNYEDVSNFQDISLTGAASVDTSGTGGGDIQVQGRRVTLTDGSVILTDTLGNSTGGNLTVRATDAVEAIGISANNPFYSGLFADITSEATGTGGNFTIETQRLLVADGAQVGANTFGAGNAGNFTVRATDVQVIGGSLLGPSGLFAGVAPGATGNGGELTIDTVNLQVSDGAQVAAITFGAGNAGSLTVRAKNVELIGASPGGFPSGLLADVRAGATGNGGNLVIQSDRLRITDGAQVSAGTFGEGNAGNLTVRAKDVEAIGISSQGPSGLFTPSADRGNGGTLTIDTERLRVADGAQIAVSTAGSGNGGDLILRADDSVELIGTSPFSRSGLFANTIIGTGDGGNLRISTDKLIIRDGAIISASNFSSFNPNILPGQGKAGNIQVQADSILLDNSLSDTSSSITASTDSGGGGNINLQAQNITARNRSQIKAETLGSGDGGSVNITTDSLNLSDRAQISTNSTRSGQAGNITISADRIQTRTGEITATSTQSGGGDINLTSDLLLLNQSLISTSVLDSTGGGGNIAIDADSIVASQNSEIQANAVFGAGGNIQIATRGLFLSRNSRITASSNFGVNGVVDIRSLEVDPSSSVVILPQEVVDVSRLVAQGCDRRQQQASSQFIITGRGGLPPNPGGILNSETVLADLGSAPVKTANRPSNTVSTDLINTSPTQVVEAQGWVMTENGQVILTAFAPTVTPHSPMLTPTSCLLKSRGSSGETPAVNTPPLSASPQ